MIILIMIHVFVSKLFKSVEILGASSKLRAITNNNTKHTNSPVNPLTNLERLYNSRLQLLAAAVAATVAAVAVAAFVRLVNRLSNPNTHN